jgi:catechol 2,3-dioxygenase-like lactoylglutathione lyase family enzyme
VQVSGIDHIVLDCADVERSVAWYRDRLGLEPVRLEEWRRDEVPFVSLRVDDTTIIDLFEQEPTGENVNHVALLVEGVDLDELAAAGEWDIEMGPADLFGAQGVGRGFYTRDPDGHLVELRTYPTR